MYNVLGWIFGVFFGLTAIASMAVSLVSFAIMITMAAIVLPPFRKFFYKQTNITIFPKNRGIALFVFFFIYLIFYIPGAQKSSEKQQKKEAVKIVERTQKQVQPEIKDYNIQFVTKHISGRTFQVDGTTNLPDGSIIFINIHDENYFKYDHADSDWRFNNLTYFGDQITIKNGAFTKTLNGSQIMAPMKSDKYEVEVSFNPRAQADNIKNIVGENGDYLEGKLVNAELKGLRMLETKQVITANDRNINTASGKAQIIEDVQIEKYTKMGIGITRDEIINIFNKIGFSFTEGVPVNGKENYVGSKSGCNIQLLGSRDNLSEASFIIIFSGDPNTDLSPSVNFFIFSNTIDNNSFDWLSGETRKITQNPQQPYSNSRIIGQNKFEIIFETAIFKRLLLLITPIK